MDLIVYGGIAIIMLTIIIRFFEWSGHMIDRVRSENEARDAESKRKRAQAVQVLRFAPHFMGLYVGEPVEIDGREHYYIPIDVPPPPITNQNDEVLPADEIKLLRGCAKLAEVSIASGVPDGDGFTGTSSNRIESAVNADGQLGVKWQEVVDYMAAPPRGWIRTDNRRGTYCTGETPNLAALRLAIAFRSLPRRER